MWYSSNIRTAASIDELWKSLNSAGIPARLGIQDKNQFSQWIANTPQGAQMLGRQIKENATDPAVRSGIGQSYTNYVSGRILAEEMSILRNQALAEGREPTVSEMRAARQRANERLVADGLFAPGLGIPSTFQVGRRGPLGKPRLNQVEQAVAPVTDPEKREVAAGLFQKAMAAARVEAVRRFQAGESPSPEPTAADLRAVIKSVNEQLKQMGIGEGIQFLVGSRGPVGTPKLVHKTDNEDEHHERKKAEERRQNLNLQPVLDVKDGNTPIPKQDITPQNIVTKSIQAGLPKPPVHEFCRCITYDVGGNIIFKTADDTACEECKKLEKLYQGAPQEAQQMIEGAG